MSKPKVSIIVATDENRGIGKNNHLLWNIPEDLEHFRNTTQGKTVIMGRITYESIGRPLPERNNIIISRNPSYNAEGCIKADSLTDALEKAVQIENKEIFIIGGAQIYSQAITLADKLYITVVKGSFDADAFFPQYDHIFTRQISKKEAFGNGYEFTFYEFGK